MNESKPEIEVQELAFQYYNQPPLLKDLTFTITKGSFTGILGPNGSGKTTLLKCLTKLLPPRKGRIILGEQDLTRLSVREIARKVGVVPQKWEANYAFTAKDLVLMGRFAHQKRFQAETAQDLAVAQEAMLATNTWKLAERPVTEMSGGELQRVIIAQALAQNPDILLLDEPTASLDINHQLEICDLIKDLTASRNLTVVAVFHDLNLAAQYCDRIILLKQGRLFAIGETPAVLTESNLNQVYETKVRVETDPGSGKPFINIYGREKAFLNQYSKISAWRDHIRSLAMEAFKIHLIGGGGMADSLYGLFHTLGFGLSTGVLNIGDTDWHTARELEISIVEAPPFSPITEELHQLNLAQIKTVDLVVLANIPFGVGNLKNLLAAEAALQMNKPLFVCDFTPFSQRDYTGGSAAQIYQNIKSSGARFSQNQDQLPGLILEQIKT
ncbi:MAG TPA: ABC transporter ATP-binding protein [Bacillota bacterium]|nr:ABC transporter ATP-binding protein [Bacillota bacterium]